MKDCYDYQRIKDLYEELVSKIKRGENMDPLNAQLGAVCGHTLDLLNISRDTSKELDIKSTTTEELSGLLLPHTMCSRMRVIPMQNVKNAS